MVLKLNIFHFRTWSCRSSGCLSIYVHGFSIGQSYCPGCHTGWGLGSRVSSWSLLLKSRKLLFRMTYLTCIVPLLVAFYCITRSVYCLNQCLLKKFCLHLFIFQWIWCCSPRSTEKKFRLLPASSTKVHKTDGFWWILQGPLLLLKIKRPGRLFRQIRCAGRYAVIQTKKWSKTCFTEYYSKKILKLFCRLYWRLYRWEWSLSTAVPTLLRVHWPDVSSSITERATRVTW